MNTLPKTTHELDVALAQLFQVAEGPQTSHFEIPLRTPASPTPGVTDTLRIVYTTISVAMRGEADVVSPVLCGWAYGRLRELLTEEQIEDHYTILFWRKHPTLMEFLDEQGRQCTALRMRLAIPALDLHPLSNESIDGAARFL